MLNRVVIRMALAATALWLIVPERSQAQFLIPIPPVLPDSVVLREDIPIRFRAWLEERTKGPATRGLDSVTKLSAVAATDAARQKVIEAFCTEERYDPKATCIAELQPGALTERLALDPELNTVERTTYLVAPNPLPLGLARARIPWRTRSAFASYLRRSGLDDGFDFASQFGASFGEDAAYVASNIVRGVAGTYLISADYAVVVAKSDTGPELQREAIEDNKTSILRAINNGGTIVGHVVVPMWAVAGGTAASAGGLSFGAGFLGPIKESVDDRQRPIGSFVVENVNSIALRSLRGTFASNTSLLIGLRAGTSYAGRAIKVDGSDRTISYGQIMIGLRQKESMAFSALVTMTGGNYQDYIPRLVINYSAAR
jgi:hypothetical protein